MKKQKKYVEIGNILAECVDYAKSLKVRMEDPNGIKRNFKISDISLTFLNNEQREVSFINGIPRDIIEINDASQLLIKIWITNKQKTVEKMFAYSEMIPNSTFLKMHFNSVIQSCIRSSVNDFFSAKTKDNKYSIVSQDEVINDLSEPATFENFSLKGLSQIEDLFKWIYIKPNIISVDGNINLTRKVWIVCNGMGTKIIQNQDHCSLSLNFDCISSKKTLIEDIFADHYKTFQKLISSLPGIKTKLTKKLAKIEQQRIEGGVYPLLFKPSAVATLFHEAIAGHMLSGSYITNGISTIFENKINKKIATKEEMPALFDISVYDQPSKKDQIGHFTYDMEGVTAQDICLLDKGTIRNYLTDKNSAARLKQNNNGHHLAQSFVGITNHNKMIAIEPEPRVSNLFIESHTDITLDDISKAIFDQEDFYLEVGSRSGQVAVDTGVFNLVADHITKVWKDGKREAITPGTFSGSLTDFLASIQMVSNKYGETTGFCGSGSGMVPTHEIAPAMLLYGINFVTEPKPEKQLHINLKKDKYVPKEWLKEIQ